VQRSVDNELLKWKNDPPPPDSVFHEKILDKLKIFQIIGGMPETVATYLKHRDFARCQKVLNDLITTIIDDFAKYKERIPLIKLQEVFYSTFNQVGGKFKYSRVSPQGRQPIIPIFHHSIIPIVSEAN